ncbi:hypothetical protein BN14_10775 [Rhizoctonia solani AG-1 IB]|uniref:Uncharacterized protein n=1 Tax=Thanatephorus cucumeris (strain AG1-IB / isolate 7/3/14) TaxID=1108050 RepID=M5C9G2_THACB|nr:hypothetical protein BN14_10775 [Rhizoctonia solani AG-1 IB]
MSAELFEYIHSVKPSLGDAKRAKVGILLIHYITLARVSDGRVNIEAVLTTSGESFVAKVLRNMDVVRGLGFALKIDMTAPYDQSPVPKRLRRLCESYGIDCDACIRRSKKPERARSDMWDLVVFVRVAQAIMGALHYETLRELDKSYAGHRPAGYKPESKWLGLGTEHKARPIRARDLPQAGCPRSMGVNAVRSTTNPEPVWIARKATDESWTTHSSVSSGRKLHVPRSPAPRRAPCVESLGVRPGPTSRYIPPPSSKAESIRTRPNAHSACRRR